MDITGWEQRYQSGAADTTETPTPLLVETAANLTPGLALDLACGAGRNALYLAKHGWQVTALDGSETAIQVLQQRAASLNLQAAVADLTAPHFTLPHDHFDLILIAFYLQRDLFAKVKASVKPGGLIVAITHTPEPGEPMTDKRTAPGELAEIFKGWPLLWTYEGPSRDPAHRRPVAEIVAQRPS